MSEDVARLDKLLAIMGFRNIENDTKIRCLLHKGKIIDIEYASLRNFLSLDHWDRPKAWSCQYPAHRNVNGDHSIYVGTYYDSFLQNKFWVNRKLGFRKRFARLGTAPTLEQRMLSAWSYPQEGIKNLFGIEIEFATDPNIVEEKTEVYPGKCIDGCCPQIAPTIIKIKKTQTNREFRDIQNKIPGVRLVNDSTIIPCNADAAEASLLIGPNGFQRLRNLCKTIKERGGYVNNTCGLHVHLDARHNIKRVAGIRAKKLWDAMPIIKELVPDTRLNDNRYCRLLPPSFTSERYHAINLRAYDKHQTIEVRIAPGSLNPIKIWHWANLLLEISNHKTALDSWDKFLDSGIRMPLKIWAIHRAHELRPNEILRAKRVDRIVPGLDSLLREEYGTEGNKDV